jgi:hypothetical protein
MRKSAEYVYCIFPLGLNIKNIPESKSNINISLSFYHAHSPHMSAVNFVHLVEPSYLKDLLINSSFSFTGLEKAYVGGWLL